jgi:hypothetical protein
MVDGADLLIKHDVAIVNMATSMESLTVIVSKMADKQDMLVESMHNQELVLEKINNVDMRSKDSFNRIHKRVDDIEAAQSTHGCTALRVLSGKNTELERRVSKIDDDKNG